MCYTFAVNQDRPDLMSELNVALAKIRDEDRYFNDLMAEKYTRTTSANLSLTPKERSWLSGHGPIRVGYQDDYMAFCAADESGELTGALKEYLALASGSIRNAPLSFETIAYPTKAAVMEALANGEIDCMFPANLTDSDAENMNFDMFLSDHFPGVTSTWYPDTTACLKAVADGEVDCLMISNYRFSSIRALCDRVLKELGAEILRFLEGSEGAGSRFGADNFLIFCTPQEDYHALLDRFQGKVNHLSDNAGIRLRMGVMPWKEGLEPVQLLDRAHTACSRVRSSDRHVVVYDEEMLEREHLNERLLNDLDRGLREHEFQVYYQPKFNVTVEPPVLSSAEALVRWQHPELGMISPAAFIPLFEENGLIQQLDRYVWREVAAKMAVWRGKYGRVFPVSVNVSRIDLFDPDFINHISALVAEEYQRFIEERLSIPEDIASAEHPHHMPRLSYEDYSYDELHDPLTSLYNIRAFDMLVKDADQYHTALLVAEVPEAGKILAEQGQAGAEQMVRHVADVMKRCFRPVDHVCRIGKARFGVIMTRVDSGIQEQVEQKIEHVNDLLNRPYNNLPAVSVTVGAAFADRTNPGESILEDAEAALNGLKERGENGCAFH